MNVVYSPGTDTNLLAVFDRITLSFWTNNNANPAWAGTNITVAGGKLNASGGGSITTNSFVNTASLTWSNNAGYMYGTVIATNLSANATNSVADLVGTGGIIVTGDPGGTYSVDGSTIQILGTNALITANQAQVLGTNALVTAQQAQVLGTNAYNLAVISSNNALTAYTTAAQAQVLGTNAYNSALAAGLTATNANTLAGVASNNALTAQTTAAQAQVLNQRFDYKRSKHRFWQQCRSEKRGYMIGNLTGTLFAAIGSNAPTRFFQIQGGDSTSIASLITYNALWITNQWIKDDTNSSSFILDIEDGYKFGGTKRLEFNLDYSREGDMNRERFFAFFG